MVKNDPNGRKGAPICGIYIFLICLLSSLIWNSDSLILLSRKRNVKQYDFTYLTICWKVIQLLTSNKLLICLLLFTFILVTKYMLHTKNIGSLWPPLRRFWNSYHDPLNIEILKMNCHHLIEFYFYTGRPY